MLEAILLNLNEVPKDTARKTAESELSMTMIMVMLPIAAEERFACRAK